MKTRTRLLFVALVGLWLGMPNQSIVAAKAFNPHVCEDICPSGQGCDHECWLTDLDFQNDAPSTTCGAEAYSCCGDGVCDPGTEGCNACTDDCGEVPTPCQTACTSNGDCSNGKVCNSDHECVLPHTDVESGGHTSPCGGECSSDSDCCGRDVCVGVDSHKYCVVPSTTYCHNSPACAGEINNIYYSNCDFGDFCAFGAKDMYCDPGIDRCMFNWGFECPETRFGHDINVCY